MIRGRTTHSTARATGVRTVVALALAATALASTGARAQQAADRVLLSAVEGGSARSAQMFDEPGIRSGRVAVNPALLSAASTARGSEVLLAPFFDTTLRITLQPGFDLNEGDIWTGRIRGDAAGSAHFRRVGQSLAGTIRHRGGIVQVLPDGPGRAVAVQAIEPRLPDGVFSPADELVLRGEVPPPTPAPRSNAGTSGSAAMSVFDLIVILEGQTVTQLRGKLGWVKTMIRNDIVDMNLALAASQVNASVRLLAIKRDRFSGRGEDSEYAFQLLRATTLTSDKEMVKTLKLRERYGADFVAVIMGRNTGVCGMGWVNGVRDGVRPDDAEFAVSVSSWRCLPASILPHEIGHNMGGQHSRLDPTSDVQGAYEQSYGLRMPQKFTTVMAYTCDFCSEALVYSNPDVTIDGIPAGIANGPDAADNAAGFERDREVMAAFRPCKRKCGGS